MMEHRKIRLSLYDYARGEVDETMRGLVSLHLAECDRCRGELEELQSVIAITGRARRSPSGERGEEFWREFPFAIEEKLAQPQAAKRNLADMFRDFMRPLFVYRRRSAGFLAAGLALGVIAGIMLTQKPDSPPLQEVAQNVARPEATPASTAPVLEVDRMQRYFRKSRMLLVGIENMKTAADGQVDFAVERHASRELLQEARYFKYQPLDSRSAKLIGDLEKILIELATIKEETGLPNVEILRGGIQQENLLFKIRMAEAIYDTSKFMKSNYNY